MKNLKQETQTNDPTTTTTTPTGIIFSLFVLLNLITYIDRGIIPGGSGTFASFLGSAHDSPPYIKATPDFGLGLLQAAFIGGFSVAILICGHLVHSIRWNVLVAVGFGIWICAAFLGGFSYAADSFWMLLIARMISGVSEASFHVVAPPMFQDRGGAHAGLWLSMYLCAMPVGYAIGYICGAFMSLNIGWQYAYFYIGLLGIPLLFMCVYITDDENRRDLYLHHKVSEGSGVTEHRSLTKKGVAMEAVQDSSLPDLHVSQTNSITFWEQINMCLSSKVLLFLILGQSVIFAVVASLGTFGGAVIIALQLFPSEESAAIAFGSAAALAGIIGMPLGGILIDKILARLPENASRNYSLTMILPKVIALVGFAILLAWPTCLPQNPQTFLLFLFLAWVLIFFSQSAITMSIMLSVDPLFKPNALAFSTLASHVLGDVPAPIFFGMMKDYLAPACIMDPQSGDFKDPIGCAEEHGGIRATLAIAYAYLTLALVFFEIARRYAKRTVELEGRRDFSLTEEGEEAEEEEDGIVVDSTQFC